MTVTIDVPEAEGVPSTLPLASRLKPPGRDPLETTHV